MIKWAEQQENKAIKDTGLCLVHEQTGFELRTSLAFGKWTITGYSRYITCCQKQGLPTKFVGILLKNWQKCNRHQGQIKCNCLFNF